MRKAIELNELKRKMERDKKIADKKATKSNQLMEEGRIKGAKSTKEKAKELGIQGFLKKPYYPGQLVYTLQKLLVNTETPKLSTQEE